MKQISRLLSFAAAAAMCFSACSPEELKNGEVNVGKFVTVHFGTENTDPASTKATLTPNAGETAFQAAWENGDTIAIKYTYVAANIPDIVKGTWDASTSKFSAEIQDLTEGEEVLEMKYQASYPYSKDGYVDFGSVRTQTGAAYNSIYDLMVAEPVTMTAKPGLDESGNAIVFPMQRQTAIAYFHFTSDNTEAITKATLKVEGEGAAIAAETVRMDPTGMNYETGLSEIVLTTTDQTADDFTLWFNVLPTTYTKMTLTVETATKTFTISNTKGGSYTAGKLYKVKKSRVAWTDKPTTIYFYESFNQTTGTGGNDGEWKGSIATNSVIYDNTGWVVSNAKGANQCLKLGTTDKIGSATTPELGIDSQSASLYFKAGAWNSTSENTTINLSVSGSGSISPASVSLVRGEWSEYECTITGANATTKLVFEAVNSNNNRFFIDEVYVYSGPKPAGITLYTVSMESVEGGTLSATPSEASAGAEVSLKATPEEGYKFNNVWTVTNAETSETIPVTGGKFTMPAANVTVSGTFSKIDYSITKTASDRGYIVAKKGDVEVETAQMGDEITLSANPNGGFEFTSWEVVDSKGTDIEVNDNKFTMPASDVTITATFRSTASYTVSFSVNGTVTKKSYKEFDAIEFPDVPAQDGVQFVGWVNSDFSGIVSTKPELVDVNTAVMGTTDIFYYAVFAENETAVFDPNDISDTPAVSGLDLTWKHTATGVTLKLSDGQLYTNGSPKTFTVNKGTSNYFQIGSDNNYTISEIVTTISETKYSIKTVSNGASLSTSGTTQTVKSDNLTSIQCFATSSYQIRATNITVKVITGYSTKIIALNEVVVSGTPAKTEYTVNEAFDPKGLTVTGTYSDGSKAAITEGISWNCTPATFTEAGSKTVKVTATVKSVASEAYDVDVTVNTISNTLKATDGTVDVNKTLDVSTLFTSNSDAEVTYTLVENPNNAGTLSGSNFSASAAGTYKVKARQAETAKYSAAEATATITVNADKLTPPANLKCSEKTETSLTFTWDAVAKASGYKVSLDGTNYGDTQQERTYKIDGLSPGTSRTIYVKAIGNQTAYTDSDAVSVTGKTNGGDTDWSSTYTTAEDVSVSVASGGTNYKVKIGENDYSAVKANKASTFTINVPEGTTKVHLFIAGWNGDTNSIMTINGGTIDKNSITADSGIGGTVTTYTLTGTISDYYRVISVNSNTTSITIKLGTGKRAVVWGVNAE